MAKRKITEKKGIVFLRPDDLVAVGPTRDQGTLGALEASISEIGLLQPILVDPDLKRVIAGRRRLAAVKALGWSTVPCWVRGDGSELRRIRIAITENVQRKALTDMEELAWIAQYDEEMQRRHGSRPKGGRPKTGQDLTGLWNRDRTARDLNISAGKVSNAIEIQKILRAHPQLAGTGSQTIIRRKAAELTARASTPKRARRVPGLVLGDSRNEVVSLDDGSVQLLLTDPPYGVNYRSASRDPRQQIPIAGDDGHAGELLTEVLTAMEPKLSPNAHCYVFTTLGDSYALLVPVIARFFKIRAYIVWAKGNSGPGTDWFAPTTEIIIFGTRGKKPRELFGKRLPNVIVRGRVPTAGRIHPTEKPIELLETLIAKSTVAGELVADPFAGSSSTLVAAKETGRRYWGAELERTYYDAGIRWLAETDVADTSLHDFPDSDAEHVARPYSFVTDAMGLDHVMFQKELGPVGASTDVFRPMRSDAPRPLRNGKPDSAAAARYRKGPGLNDDAMRMSYEPACANVEARTAIALPPLRVCKDCARWLASHGHRNTVSRAAASEREFWVTNMIAPAEYDRVLKPKVKARPSPKPKAKKVA